jgi:hypothetical protein
MPAKFEGLGLQFQYPENWTLDDSDALLGRKSVTVYSPGGAFWSVAVHFGPVDPAKLAKIVVDAMRQEYAALESEEVSETIAGYELHGYDLNFYYLDLTNTAQVRCLLRGQTTYTIFCQADDREFKQLQRVFQAISTSLINDLDKTPPPD